MFGRESTFIHLTTVGESSQLGVIVSEILFSISEDNQSEDWAPLYQVFTFLES